MKVKTRESYNTAHVHKTVLYNSLLKTNLDKLHDTSALSVDQFYHSLTTPWCQFTIHAKIRDLVASATVHAGEF